MNNSDGVLGFLLIVAFVIVLILLLFKKEKMNTQSAVIKSDKRIEARFDAEWSAKVYKGFVTFLICLLLGLLLAIFVQPR